MSLGNRLPRKEAGGGQYFLLYDGHCRICRFFARIVKRLDVKERMMLLSLYDPVAPSVGKGVTPEEYFRSFHLVDPESRVVSGEDALPGLVSLLPAGQLAVGILNSVPGTLMILEMLYRAAVRGRTVMLCGGRASPRVASPPV